MDRNHAADISTRREANVALRKESVDRNYSANAVDQILPVALRKESVDRNLAWHCISEDVSCRSPQGERG